LDEGVPERIAPTVLGFPQRREFSGEPTVWVAPAEFRNTHSTSGNRFFCSGGILFTQSTVWVLITAHFISRRAKSNTAGAKTALREILLQEEIQG
jgi:hypothetical protein